MAEKKKRGITFPHMFTLILLIIAVCTILTYIVPAGQYDTYVDDNDVEVFVDGSYHRVEQTPVTPMKALMSVQEGIIETANIAAFIFVIGGAFGVVAETKAIEAGIGRIIKKTSKRQGLLIPIMIFVVGFGAGSFGMFEECLVFIPFLVPICIAMGYDSITGLAVAIVGSSSGYAGSFVQPANVGVSQSIAGLPLYSGMWYRLIILVVMLTIAAVYVYLYARRIKADPTRSLMYEFDRQREEKVDLDELPELTGTRKVVLLVMGAAFALLIVGVLQWGWYLNELSALFLGMGIIVGFVGRVGLNGFGVLFGRGVADFATGALAVGFAQIIAPFSDATPIMKYAYVLVYMAVLLTADLGLSFLPRPRGGMAVSGVLALCLAGVTLYSANINNLLYTAADQAHRATLSYATRLLTRIESCPGYTGEEEVLIIGSFPTDRIYADIESYALVDHYSVPRDTVAPLNKHIYYYFNDWLNVPIAEPGEETMIAVAQSEEFQAMPLYPADGSVRMLDGRVVVKIQEEYTPKSDYELAYENRR